MAFQITDGGKRKVTLKPLNKFGKPAPIDGIPQWNSSDSGVVAVTPEPDGMSGYVSSVGQGTAEVDITADADLGEGMTPVTAVVAFEVVAATTATLGTEVGEEESL